MNRLALATFLLCGPVIALSQAAELSDSMSTKVKTAPVVSLPIKPFSLDQIRVLPSPFQDNLKINGEYLLTLDPKRLLHRHFLNNGLTPKGDIYGGWESDTISGHTFGHWLSGLSLSYAATGNSAYKNKATEAITLLKEAQDARPDGFVGGYPNADKLHQELRQGEITSKGFDLNGLWVPWYNQHKLFAGLFDVYLYCNDPRALDIAKKLGDFTIWVTANLTDEQWEEMLHAEHGGINESLATLSSLTGDSKYLDLAKKFYHHRVLDPLASKEPKLANLHGNTQIPIVIGAARIYELTGDTKFKTISEYFFKQVIDDHTYANGGNTSGEYFGPPGILSRRLSDSTSETCNTYNMLKLAEHLYAWTGDPQYQDYYERAMWNHILGSQNARAGKTYYVPLRIGGRKTYSTAYTHFTCCHGSGMESQAKYGTAIFAHDDKTLYINQYVPAELNWKDKDVQVTLETDLPNSGKVKFTFLDPGKGDLQLKFRFPSWATEAKSSKGNLLTKGEDGYLVFHPQGSWKEGDTVEFELPLSFHQEPLPDAPHRVALFYGPVLLAGDLEPLVQNGEIKPLPVLVTDNKPTLEWLKPTGPATFQTQSVGRPQQFNLKPFYEFNNEHYTVYWDLFTESEWNERKAAYEAEEELRRDLERRTVDVMAPGNMQSERDHNVQGENTSAGDFGDRTYRHATNGGWFSFDLKVDESVENALLLTFWGTDGGNRTFDVLIDDKKVKEIILERNQPGKFFDERIPLAPELIKGKSKVTIKLQARPNGMAGGLFGARIVRIIHQS